MKRIFLPILTVLLFCSYSHAQLCADSSFHATYTLADSLFPTNEISLKDSGRLQLLETYRTGNTSRYNLLIRYANNNQTVWQKKLEPGPGLERIEASRSLELTNGNLIISGFATQSSTHERFFYAAGLSGNGHLLWQRTFDFRDIISVAGSFGVSNKINGAICAGRSDSLLFSFYVESESTVGDKIAVLCTDGLGNTGWGTTVVVPTVAESWVTVAKTRVTGNTLWMYGAHTSIDFCPDATPSPGYINKGKLMAIAFDLDTHTITSQRSYCPPITNIMNASGSVPGYQHYSGLNDASFYGQDVFFLNNGQIALTRSRLRATNSPSIKNWLFSISYFDEQFNHIKSEMVSTGDLFIQSVIQSITIDPDGNKHFNFINYANGTAYYAVCDKSNQFVLQKKIRGGWTSPLLSQFRFDINQGRFTNFELFNVVNNQTQLHYFEVNPVNADPACFGEDTTFLTIEPGTVSNAGLRGIITTRPSVLLEQPVNGQLQEIQLSRDIVCVDKNICDTLQLTFNMPACNTADTVRFTANKNPFCKGPILFLFDSSAVSYYSQPDDTSLLLVPAAGEYHGNVIAVASSCPQLKDTVSVDISLTSSRLNIGADRSFCPGNSYRLTAGPLFSQYRWQDGSTDSVFIARQPGYYSVSVMDECRIYSDTIHLQPVSATLDAGADTAICKFSALQLRASTGFTGYTWRSLLSGETKQGNPITIRPEQSILYVLEADLFEGCRLADTIAITVKQCANNFYVPTAFTPNHDGLNDRFRPFIDGALVSYRFSIFNRWGELLFSSTDPDLSWDGYWKGKLQPAGTFIWKCEYKFYDAVAQMEKGTVTLIR